MRACFAQLGIFSCLILSVEAPVGSSIEDSEVRPTGASLKQALFCLAHHAESPAAADAEFRKLAVDLARLGAPSSSMEAIRSIAGAYDRLMAWCDSLEALPDSTDTSIVFDFAQGVRESVLEISPVSERCSVLCKLSRNLMRFGLASQAQQVLRKMLAEVYEIPNGEDRRVALGGIASRLFAAGRRGEAEMVLSELQREADGRLTQQKEDTQHARLEWVLAGMQEYGRAEHQARQIHDPLARVTSLVLVASLLVEARRPDAARQVLVRAFNVAQSTPAVFAEAYILSELAGCAARMGSGEWAVAMLRGSPETPQRVAALLTVGNTLRRLGDLDHAQLLFEAATESAHTPSNAATATIGLARVIAAIGRKQEGQLMVERWWLLNNREGEEPEEVAQHRYHAIEALVEMGAAAKAEELAASLIDGQARERAFFYVACFQAQAGDGTGAFRVIDRIADPSWQHWALTQGCSALLEGQHFEEAMQMVRCLRDRKASWPWAESSWRSSLFEIGIAVLTAQLSEGQQADWAGRLLEFAGIECHSGESEVGAARADSPEFLRPSEMTPIAKGLRDKRHIGN